MDWVHCNNCYIQPGQLPKRNYYLTSCGHIFCQYCENPGTIEQCKVCKGTCTTTPLTSEMAKEVQLYFEDPEEMFRSALKVSDFQRNHRQRLNESLRLVKGKYQNAKLHIQQLEKEIRALKQELDWYKQKDPNSFTPPSQPKSGPPLLAKNSQASKAIRMGLSQSSNSPSSFENRQFLIPGRPQFANQSYRMIPSTPYSDSSNSPISLTPRSGLNLSGQKQMNTPNMQSRGYSPGLTPPLSNLKLLSIAGQQSRFRKPF